MLTSHKTSSYVGLLGIQLFKAKDKEIAKAMTPPRKYNFLPEYCLRREDDPSNHPYVINETEAYHQFAADNAEAATDSGDDKQKNILFTVCPCDDIISEEVSNTCGYEELLKGIFKKPEDLKKLFDKMGYSSFRLGGIPATNYFLVRCIWSCSDTECGYEYDTDVYVIGYLDNELNKVLLKGEEIE